MQLRTPPALNTLKSTIRKQMGPAKSIFQKEAMKNHGSFQHISQDKSASRATTGAGHKGYSEPGKEKNLQVISHLQDDTLQWHKNNKRAQENWKLEVRGGFLTFQSADLWTSCSRSTGEKRTELVPGQVHDLQKITVFSSRELDLMTHEVPPNQSES